MPHLLLGVMLYMHVCSAWCALFSGNCCTEGKEQCHKSEKKSNHQTGDCQDYHLSFFNAAGQFASEKNVEAESVFPFVVAEIPWSSLPFFIETGRNPLAFISYHPPPPIADIRIFIQSFQI